VITKRGRKTAGDLTAVRPADPARPVPGDELTAEEAAVFRGIVAAVTPDHFQESYLVLLVAYCQAVCQHRRAVEALRAGGEVTADGKPSPWLKVAAHAVRTMMGLSMRLRISPQARREKARVPTHMDWTARRLLKQEADYD
jgi:phage terminase small subunit